MLGKNSEPAKGLKTEPMEGLKIWGTIRNIGCFDGAGFASNSTKSVARNLYTSTTVSHKIWTFIQWDFCSSLHVGMISCHRTWTPDQRSFFIPETNSSYLYQPYCIAPNLDGHCTLDQGYWSPAAVVINRHLENSSHDMCPCYILHWELTI